MWPRPRDKTALGLKTGPTFNKFGVLGAAVDDEAVIDREVTSLDAMVEVVATVERVEVTGVEDVEVEERKRRSTSLYMFSQSSNASIACKFRTAS